MIRALSLLGFAVLAVGGHPVAAQAQWPHWVGIGGAIGGAAGRGGEYSDRARAVWRLSAEGRVVVREGTSVIVAIDRERVFTDGDRVDICALGSHGQCMPEFPEFSGWVGAAGLRSEVFNRFAVTALAGLGRHRSTDGAVRHLPDDAGSGLMVHGDVALRAWRGVWLTAAARHTELGAIRGDPLRLRTITVGLRVN